MATTPAPTPDLAALGAAVVAFDPQARPDPAWNALLAATSPAPDLAVAEHRRAVLVWLNAWGCRIRYPRQGEPDLFDQGIASWWARFGATLPGRRVGLADLTERHLGGLGRSFAELAAAPAGTPDRPRTVGPTAASKLLYALRPRAVVPWDDAIAVTLHGARDGAAFAAHQRLGRDWARSLLAGSGVNEATLAVKLGRPGRPLSKMLDDYWYVSITRGAARRPGSESAR